MIKEKIILNKSEQDQILNNLAFVDGQNLYMATTTNTNPWQIDLARFRVYLERKYKTKKAFYYLGYVQEKNQELYEEIQNAGFVLVFREHNPAMIGKKKGNVDSDIIFNIMKKLYRKEDFGKIILISGDGDYKLLVDFLIEENRLEKVLFPDGKRASTLYKKLGTEYYDSLDSKDIRNKIGKTEKEKGSLGS